MTDRGRELVGDVRASATFIQQTDSLLRVPGHNDALVKALTRAANMLEALLDEHGESSQFMCDGEHKWTEIAPWFCAHCGWPKRYAEAHAKVRKLLEGEE